MWVYFDILRCPKYKYKYIYIGVFKKGTLMSYSVVFSHYTVLLYSKLDFLLIFIPYKCNVSTFP